MKRRALAVALSALTLVGGHFYNRRWDRAVLFFVAFVLWGLGVYASLTFQMNRLMDATGGAAFFDVFQGHVTAFGVGSLLLWLASLIVAFVDGGRTAEAPLARWTGSGVAAAVGLSIVSSLALALAAATSGTVRVGHEPYETKAAPEPVRHAPRHFSHYVYLGRSTPSGSQAPAPPAGDGYLRGRFVFEDRPAAGVELTLTLNGKYETGRLTTDENGEFTVRVPSGDWFVNMLVTHAWSEKPEEGEYMIVTGHEPKLVGDDWNEHHWLERDGIRVEVGGQPKEPQLTFTIRRRVSVNWPGPGTQATRTSVDQGVVTWEPYPGADAYLVRITELEREGRSTTFHGVAAKKVAGDTRFPLARLQALPSREGEKEYQVSVSAFAKDGSLLSESNNRLDGRLFVLADAKQFLRDSDRIPGSDAFSARELEEAHDNNRRIEAVAVLLKDGLVGEAERLLGKVKGKTDPGKKAAVTGYLMASRGRCAEAKRLFAQALSEGGRTCVPQHYRAGCGE